MKGKPKILFLDVENSPNKSLTWPGRMYDINLAGFVPNGRWQLLSFSWAWNDEKIQYDSKEKDNDDKRIVGRMIELLNAADFVVTHNGNTSDLPKIRTRAKAHKLATFKDVQSVDTYRVLKPRYLLDSYSLGNVCEYFGLGKKKDAGGIATWIGCDIGDPKAWTKMRKYNPHDVVLLRRLYKFLQKELPNHPSIHKILYPHDRNLGVCPICSSKDCMKRGFRGTRSTAQQQWLCRACGRWFLTRIPPRRKKGML